MNHDSNNLNQNNFNIQSNNGIPNNQPLNNQNFNSNQPKKMNLGLIIGIVAIVAVVGVGIVFGSKLFSKNNSIDNSDSGLNNNSNSNQENDSISNSNEIIKIESSGDGYETFMLDAAGKVYACGSISESFIEVKLETEYKVVDIASTDVGMLFKFENGELYLMSYDIKSDKEITTSWGNRPLKRIMVDDIIQYTTNSITPENTLKFLKKNGELYELVYNAYNDIESNVRVIMKNVKKVESSSYNVTIIDKDNNAYVYGYNVDDKGILGTSDYAIAFEDKEYISYPVKIGENIKEIEVASRPLMYNLAVYYINTNNELYVMGQSVNNNYFMGEMNAFLDKPVKILDNAKDIHAMMGSVIVETIDGKLVQVETTLDRGKKTEITTDYKTVVLPKSGYGGIFILTNNNDLYGYGNNDSGKFGLGEYEWGKIYPLTKLKQDVKSIFISKDYNGNKSFVVMNDGSVLVAGGNTNGALGVPNQEKVTTFTKIDY